MRTIGSAVTTPDSSRLQGRIRDLDLGEGEQVERRMAPILYGGFLTFPSVPFVTPHLDLQCGTVFLSLSFLT